MYSKTCRLCLSDKDNNTLVEPEADEISERVYELFGIQLELNNELPQQICISCISVINDFYSFRDGVSMNQTKLLEQLEQSKKNVIAQSETLKVEDDNGTNFIITIIESKGHKNLTKSLRATKTTTDIPPSLNTRMTKSKSDELIKEFMILECTICEKLQQYDSYKNLMDHYKNDHNTKGFVVCCEKKIFRKDRLLDHITNHVNPKAFKCPTCGQVSKNKVLLRIHMKQHLPKDQRQFQCKHCEHKFVLKSQLTNHVASHLKEAEKKFVCDICLKAFALNFVLEKHKLTHRKDNRNFYCDICAKSFSTKPNLMAHRANHNDGPETRVQCFICSNFYKNNDTLRAHLRQHKEQEQDHVCEYCDKRCTTKSSLQSHVRYVHLKIAHFSCDLCDKQFRKKVELVEHLARHSGKALYQCPVCPKSFKSSSNYFSHRKTKHDLGKTLKSTVFLKDEDVEQVYEVEIYGETSENDVGDDYVLINNRIDP